MSASKKINGEPLSVLTEQIEKKEFSPVYCIFGNEPYLKFFYIDQIRKTFLSADSLDGETYTYDGDTLSADEFRSVCESYSMLSEGKVIIVKDCSPTGEIAKLTVSDPDIFSPDNVIIFYFTAETPDTKAEEASAFFEKIASVGKLIKIDHPDERTAIRWIIKQCSIEGLYATDTDAKYLLDTVGPSMYRLQSEIKKLRFYSDDGRLKQTDIDDLCEDSAEIRGYLITNAIIEADPKKAFSLIEDILKSKDGNEYIIAATVFGYICKLWRVKLMLDKKFSKEDIASGIGVKNAYSYINFAKAHSLETIEEMIDSCVKADLSLKSTNMPENVTVYRLVTELIGKV